MKNFLSGKKTYLVAIVAILAALVGWVEDSLTTTQFIEAIIAAIVVVCMRAGIAKVIVPLLISILLLPLVGGCMAPPDTRAANAMVGKAIQVYLVNSVRIHQAEQDAYADARQRDSDYTVKKTIQAIQIKYPMLTPAQFEVEVIALLAERDKVVADTARVIRAMKAAVAETEKTARQGIALNVAISEWMAAGIDETAIPGMLDDLTNILTELKKPVLTSK